MSKRGLGSNLKTSKDPVMAQLVQELDRWIGHAETMPNESGNATKVRVNTTTRKFEALIGGTWTVIG